MPAGRQWHGWGGETRGYQERSEFHLLSPHIAARPTACKLKFADSVTVTLTVTVRPSECPPECKTSARHSTCTRDETSGRIPYEPAQTVEGVVAQKTV